MSLSIYIPEDRSLIINPRENLRMRGNRMWWSTKVTLHRLAEYINYCRYCKFSKSKGFLCLESVM